MGLRVFPALLYGKGHAYGNPLTGSGTEASVSKLTRDDLVKFHHTWFRPNNATLVVVGDTTLAELTPKLEKLFAGWQRGDVPHKNISRVEFPPKPVVYMLDRPGALQSDIMVGRDRAAEEQSRGDRHRDHELDPGRRLRRPHQHEPARGQALVLRRAESSLRMRAAQQPFLVYAPVQTDKTKESLAELEQGTARHRGRTPAHRRGAEQGAEHRSL